MSLKKLELLIAPPHAVLFFTILSVLAGIFSLSIDGWLLINNLAIKVWLMCLLVGVAIIFTLAANRAFYQAGTSSYSPQPDLASKLVTDGIYGISRNPTYLAMFLTLLGVGFSSSSWISLLLPWLFLLYIKYFQIIPEEKILQKKFGKEYINYCKSVRRWL